MQSNRWIQFWGCISIITIVMIELLIDKAYFSELSFCARSLESASFYVAVILLLLSIVINRKYVLGNKQNKYTLKEKIIILVSNSCSGSILDVLFVLVFLFYLAWIPDTCFDYARDGLPVWRPFLYISGFILTIFVKPDYRLANKSIDKDKRMLLVTGMSNLKYSIQNGCAKNNIEPLILPFGEFPSLKEMLILFSKDTLLGIEDVGRIEGIEHDVSDNILYSVFDKYKKRIEKIIKAYGIENGAGVIQNKEISGLLLSDKKFQMEVQDALSELIKNCIDHYYPQYDTKQLNIEFTSCVNYNDFEECNKDLYNRLSYLMRYKRIDDEHVVVNITGGTSIVSGVMTLNAIKGNRGLVYVEQGGKPILKHFNPNVIVLEQFDELVIEKIENK